MTGLRRQLDDRSREVEQLTTLSLKGDATLQEYMAQLTVSTLMIMPESMRNHHAYLRGPNQLEHSLYNLSALTWLVMNSYCDAACKASECL